jgi:phage portal protein BeeE
MGDGGWRDLMTRGIRPPEGPTTPNANDPADVPPASVGPPAARPGDPDGLTFESGGVPGMNPPARIVASPWSGWPGEWATPAWSGGGWAGGAGGGQVTDTAWACLDLNASVLASMPPYLVGAGTGLDSAWLTNPDPDIYTGWQEFAKALAWDYMLGEAFVLVTARYASGWPARFHVVAPWFVNVEMASGQRRYSIGSENVTGDILHVRYQSRTDDAHGHGPLEAGAGRLALEGLLMRYVGGFAAAGGVPSSILTHPDELTSDQANALQAAWIAARVAAAGAPAVLSGGVEWKATQTNPADAGSADLLEHTQSRIAILLGVPPFLVGLPSGGDSMTYTNVSAIFDYHWRASLRPKAGAMTAALSGFLLPRGVGLELDRDAYVQPGPLERSQVYQNLHALEDDGQRAITVAEIRHTERFDESMSAGRPAPNEPAPAPTPAVTE